MSKGTSLSALQQQLAETQAQLAALANPAVAVANIPANIPVIPPKAARPKVGYDTSNLTVSRTSFQAKDGKVVEMLSIHDKAIPADELTRWNAFHSVSVAKAQATFDALYRAGFRPTVK